MYARQWIFLTLFPLFVYHFESFALRLASLGHSCPHRCPWWLRQTLTFHSCHSCLYLIRFGSFLIVRPVFCQLSCFSHVNEERGPCDKASGIVASDIVRGFDIHYRPNLHGSSGSVDRNHSILPSRHSEEDGSSSCRYPLPGVMETANVNGAVSVLEGTKTLLGTALTCLCHFRLYLHEDYETRS